MSKTNDFISKEFDTIIKDSREYRAYDLGMASGYFQLYKYIKSDVGEEKTNEQFKLFMEGTERMYEYFRKLVEIDKQPSTEAEILIEKINEHYSKS